jgi:hypothetical protein
MKQYIVYYLLNGTETKKLIKAINSVAAKAKAFMEHNIPLESIIKVV